MFEPGVSLRLAGRSSTALQPDVLTQTRVSGGGFVDRGSLTGHREGADRYLPGRWAKQYDRTVVVQRPKLLRRNHREQLFRFQTHALTDYLHHWDDESCDGIARQAEWAKLLCPLCLGFWTLDDLDEDHAPQEAGQSRLGGRHLTILACRSCNQRAGNSFEGTAALQRATLRPPDRDYCDVHHHGSKWTRKCSGFLVPVDYVAFDLTDVKAAYQLAFATLGYSWIVTPRLNELRGALRDGRPSGDYVIADAHDDDGLDAFAVYEVIAPVPCIVVKADRIRVCLPARLSPPNLASEFKRLEQRTGPDVFGSRLDLWKMRRYPWPVTTIGPGRTPEKTWDHSPFFALDRCGDSDHGHPIRTPRNEATVFAA